jgi:aromatic ring-opening dioxygenase catalytic subunit (LigB family)
MRREKVLYPLLSLFLSFSILYSMSKATATSKTLPTMFVGHGGGPCFFLPTGMMGKMGADSASRAFYDRVFEKHLKQYGEVKSILLISAHWESTEEGALQVLSWPEHKSSKGGANLLFDYYGFSPDMYAPHFTYPCVGSEVLASRLQQLLPNAKRVDPSRRGYDHGVFIPLKVMFPKADVPVVQLSLASTQNPQVHWDLGTALAPLRDEGVLIIGSGLITHNMQKMRASMMRPDADPLTRAFVDATREACAQDLHRLATLPAEMSREFDETHPRGNTEHYLPIVVAAGAVGKGKGTILHEEWITPSSLIDCILFE